MKKNAAIFLVALIVLSFVGPAYCGGPLRKLGRGISNVITSPLEIPNRMGKTYSSSGFYESCTYGVIQGFVMTGFRFGVGLIELATFLIPLPERYEPMLSDPEFFINFSSEKKG